MWYARAVVQARRPVNWSVMLGDDVPVPVLVPKSGQGELASLLSAFNTLPGLDDADTIVCRAIELARSHIGLMRVAVPLAPAPQPNFLQAGG